MSSGKVLKCFIPCVLFLGVIGAFGQDIADVRDSDNILPERERARIMNEWLEWRLDHILPQLMEREGIDMWLVICREPNEDPVYLTLMPEPHMNAWRTSILIFHYLGRDKGVVCPAPWSPKRTVVTTWPPIFLSYSLEEYTKIKSGIII